MADVLRTGEMSDGELLEAILELPPAYVTPLNPHNFDYSLGVNVGINSAAVTNATSVMPIIGASGLRPCAAVLANTDDDICEIGVCHYTTQEYGNRALDGMLHALGVERKELTLQIEAGWADQSLGMATVVSFMVPLINRYEGIIITGADFPERDNNPLRDGETKQIIFDARTKGIVRSTNMYASEGIAVDARKFKLFNRPAMLPERLIFDGRSERYQIEGNDRPIGRSI